MKYIISATVFCFLFSCQAEKKTPINPVLKAIPNPCTQGGEPNLFVSETGQLYLSWVEYLNYTTDALVFSILKKNKWSAPQTIASGSDWFVNWADFPSIVSYKNDGQSLAAHWLQMSAPGTYDYDVRIAQSFDGGKNWGSSFIPHRDSISAEHGFVSMVPISENKIFATWLDGRNTKEEGHDKHGSHGHHGAMSLRGAIFDKNGKLYDEKELDGRVCDCCQTSAAMTDQGIIVAYRDRSEKEIRDIGIVRQVDGKWQKPYIVFADNWHITGCPVNGASIKAEGKNVAIVWFSMPDGKAEVKAAFSHNSGKTFLPPIRIDNGNPLGRVDIILLSENEALVSWLEKTEYGADIMAVKINSSEKTNDAFLLAKSNGSRKSGFPKMAKINNEIIVAWTDADSLTRVRTGILNLEN